MDVGCCHGATYLFRLVTTISHYSTTLHSLNKCSITYFFFFFSFLSIDTYVLYIIDLNARVPGNAPEVQSAASVNRWGLRVVTALYGLIMEIVGSDLSYPKIWRKNAEKPTNRSWNDHPYNVSALKCGPFNVYFVSLCSKYRREYLAKYFHDEV